MNDSNEPSYYEIALTNRQVLVAFVVLLLSILGAFVGGVWLGRGGGRSAEEGQIAEVEDAPSDLDGVEEISFLSGQGGDSGQGRDAATPEGEPVHRPPPPTRPAPPPPRDTAPRESAASRGAPTDTTLAQDLGTDRVVPPASAPPRRPAPSPDPIPAQPRATPGSGPGFVIQVFSGRDENQARQILAVLRADKRAAFLSPVAVGSLTMFRVRVGPYGDRAQADRAATEITTKHKLDTWITAVE